MPGDDERLVALLVSELGLDPAALSPDTPLSDIVDSLDWVALLTELERQFDVRVDPEQGLALRTVGDLLRHVRDARVACA